MKPPTFHIVSIVISAWSWLGCVTASGCTGPMMLPKQPFFVIWNHPTSGCEKHGIHLGLEDWGIVDNNKDLFFGEDIGIFYEMGIWPHYFSNGSAFNGGLPQSGDLTRHLNKAKSDIAQRFPESSFSGLGVIDHEVWRPLWQLNWGPFKIYQRKSMDLVKQKYPLLNYNQQMAEATKEFEHGARDFMEATLSQARNLRPVGRWGYYGYPRCWDKYCNTTTLKENDQLEYIFNISTGLFPSIYFNKDTVSPEQRELIIKEKIRETLRVKAKYSPHNATIFPYALNQNGPYSLFMKEDLAYSIAEPANMGSAGVVLWGSSSSLRARNECVVLQNYIHNTLGPYVINITNFFGNCSEQLCNGNGRCVRKDYETIYQHYLRKSNREACLIDDDFLVMGQSFEKTIEMKNKSNKSLKFQSMNLRKSSKWKNNIIGSLKKFKKRYSGFPSKQQPVEDMNYLISKKNESVGYDFDDYVCKCFENWSGIHCDQN